MTDREIGGQVDGRGAGAGGRGVGAGDQPPAPLVLLWGLGVDAPKGAALHELFRALGIRVKDVAPDQLGERVGLLAELPGFAVPSAPASPEVPTAPAAGPSSAIPPAPAADPAPAGASVDEFALFCHMPDEQVMGLVRLMRTAGLAVGCKAALTEHNRSWPFVELLREVAEEHAAMARMCAQA